ncbi:hypothetical protein LguiB_028220 [Lonicera macranthoides]
MSNLTKLEFDTRRLWTRDLFELWKFLGVLSYGIVREEIRVRTKKFKEQLNGMIREVREQMEAWKPIKGMQEVALRVADTRSCQHGRAEVSFNKGWHMWPHTWKVRKQSDTEFYGPVKTAYYCLSLFIVASLHSCERSFSDSGGPNRFWLSIVDPIAVKTKNTHTTTICTQQKFIIPSSQPQPCHQADGSATLNVEDARTLESREFDGRWKPQPNA